LATVRLSEEEVYIGIAGYLSYIVQLDTTVDARILHCDTIQHLLDQHNIGLNLGSLDFDVIREQRRTGQEQQKICSDWGQLFFATDVLINNCQIDICAEIRIGVN